MPHVTIQMLEGRTVEQKRNVCKKVSEVLAEEINVKAENVVVIIEEMKRENFYQNGQLIIDKT